MNVGEWIFWRAAIYPEGPFLKEEEARSFTNHEFNERVNRMAHALAAWGVGKGERVAVLMSNSSEFLEIFFACAKTGAIMVPVNFRLAVPELAYIFKDCAPRILIYSADFADKIGEVKASWPGMPRLLPPRRRCRGRSPSRRGRCPLSRHGTGSPGGGHARRSPLHHVHLRDDGGSQGGGADARKRVVRFDQYGRRLRDQPLLQIPRRGPAVPYRRPRRRGPADPLCGRLPRPQGVLQRSRGDRPDLPGEDQLHVRRTGHVPAPHPDRGVGEGGFFPRPFLHRRRGADAASGDPEIPGGEGDLLFPGVRNDGDLPHHLAGSGGFDPEGRFRGQGGAPRPA